MKKRIAHAWISVSDEFINIRKTFLQSFENHFYNDIGQGVYRDHNELSSKWCFMRPKITEFNYINKTLKTTNPYTSNGSEEIDVMLRQY